MSSIKNRVVSFFLSSIMILTIIFGALPPLTAYAAEGGTGGFRITSPSDGGEINGSETVKVKWKSYSGADHYWIAIKDTATGSTIVNEECSGTSYSVYSDDDVFTVNGREYKIYVAAMNKKGEVLNGGSAWHAIYVENCMECDHEYEEEIIDSDYDYDDEDYEGHYYSHEIEYTCEYCGDSYTDWTDEDFEEHTWDSKTSTCEYCDCVLPELTTDFFSVKDEYNLGDVLKFTGSIEGNGSDILRVQVNVQRPGKKSEVHFPSRTVNSEYFYLSNVNDITLDKVGEWAIYIWAVDVAQNGYNSDEAEKDYGTFVYRFDVVDECEHTNTKIVETWWEHTAIPGDDEQHSYTVTYDIVCKDCDVVVEEDLYDEELEDHDFDSDGECVDCGYILTYTPKATSISPAKTAVNTVEKLDFTITTNSAAEHGIAIYADNTFLAEVKDYDTYSSYLEYNYEHRFMSAGTKTIYAYPLDANGDAIKNAGISCALEVKAPYGQIGQPKISTQNYTKVMRGNSIQIKWEKLTPPSSGVVYNLYLYDFDTGKDVFVNKEPITGTSFTIPASAFTGEGLYMVHLYAMAEGYSQNGSAIYLDVCGSDFLLGDVNSDGNITNKDRFVLNRYLEKMSGYTIDKKNADIDGDGDITDNDCAILARHLAKWPGYEDLYIYHKLPTETPEVPGATPDEPEEEPFVDTSKWQMSFSSTAVNINVSLKSGTPDTSKSYIFVAENTAGLHHAGTIPAGKTAVSFSVSSLQMPRGRYYDYYVVPFDVALVPENKDNYRIDSGYLPLYAGSMITSVKSGDRTISNGDTIYANEPLTIKWDGSLGVNSFRLAVDIGDRLIHRTVTNNSGPGTVSIDANVVKAGTLKITATVEAPEGTGLNDAVTVWTGTVIEKPVDSTEVINDMMGTYFDTRKAFEKYDDLAKDEISIGLFDLVFADITDLGGVVEKVVGRDADTVNAKHTIVELLDQMDDEYYVAAVNECVDVTVALYEYIKKTPLDSLKSLFKGVSDEASAIEAITNLKGIEIDNINNELSQYIEYLFDIGMDDSAVMDRMAEVLVMQNNNLSKKQAIKKVGTAASSFSKATKGIVDTLDNFATVGEILGVLANAGFEDYSVQLIKLNVLREALDCYNYTHLSKAASELEQEMNNRLLNLSKQLIKKGVEEIAQAASGLWGIVSAAVSITVGGDAMAKRDACYLLEIEDAIYYHMMALKSEYLNTQNNGVFQQLKQELHVLADCRAMLNSIAMDLNKWGIIITNKEKYNEFGVYVYWYNNQHDDIERLFN